MEKSEVQKELIKFRDFVIKESQRNLIKQRKNVSRELYDSLKGEVKTMPNSISIEFSMEDYGTYQDLGIKGKNSSSNAPRSPFKFGKGTGQKGGLTKAIQKWVKQRRIQFKDRKSGRFMSYNSTAFIITRSIYSKGIKPSMFFTAPFQKAYKKLPQELVEKYGLDAVKLFNEQVDQIFKSNG